MRKNIENIKESFKLKNGKQLLALRHYKKIFSQKSKGKVHPCTGTDALYRPYGP